MCKLWVVRACMHEDNTLSCSSAVNWRYQNTEKGFFLCGCHPVPDVCSGVGGRGREGGREHYYCPEQVGEGEEERGGLL